MLLCRDQVALDRIVEVFGVGTPQTMSIDVFDVDADLVCAALNPDGTGDRPGFNIPGHPAVHHDQRCQVAVSGREIFAQNFKCLCVQSAE